MDWIVVAVQWLHVLLGILWFGNALVLDVIVIPAINRLPMVTQRDVASLIGARSVPIFHVVVPLIVVLGFIRGTFLGPIKNFDVLLGSPYGLTWLVALSTTVVTYLWGLVVILPALRTMGQLPLSPDGKATPDVERATNRVKRVVSLELLGFFVIFSCMILMRFGA